MILGYGVRFAPSELLAAPYGRIMQSKRETIPKRPNTVAFRSSTARGYPTQSVCTSYVYGNAPAASYFGVTTQT